MARLSVASRLSGICAVRCGITAVRVGLVHARVGVFAVVLGLGGCASSPSTDDLGDGVRYRPPAVLSGVLERWDTQWGAKLTVDTMLCTIDVDEPSIECTEPLLPIEFEVDSWGRFSKPLPPFGTEASPLLRDIEWCGVEFSAFAIESIILDHEHVRSADDLISVRHVYSMHLVSDEETDPATLGVASWWYVVGQPPEDRCEFTERTTRYAILPDFAPGWNLLLQTGIRDPEVGWVVEIRAPRSSDEFGRVRWHYSR